MNQEEIEQISSHTEVEHQKIENSIKQTEIYLSKEKDNQLQQALSADNIPLINKQDYSKEEEEILQIQPYFKELNLLNKRPATLNEKQSKKSRLKSDCEPNGLNIDDKEKFSNDEKIFSFKKYNDTIRLYNNRSISPESNIFISSYISTPAREKKQKFYTQPAENFGLGSYDIPNEIGRSKIYSSMNNSPKN